LPFDAGPERKLLGRRAAIAAASSRGCERPHDEGQEHSLAPRSAGRTRRARGTEPPRVATFGYLHHRVADAPFVYVSLHCRSSHGRAERRPAETTLGTTARLRPGAFGCPAFVGLGCGRVISSKPVVLRGGRQRRPGMPAGPPWLSVAPVDPGPSGRLSDVQGETITYWCRAPGRAALPRRVGRVATVAGVAP
jgi:hypothetical protein